ncbi:hypothetical protein Tcan_14478 [Toxocara canis]|uniref:Uncharacterized protein n=1 Tax=Toxocara canis TaxID=6265 RepID=A0A0B2VCE6_TOXCA|nr:hypothetical protein Tcan_14478 [Toxocara canis]
MSYNYCAFCLIGESQEVERQNCFQSFYALRAITSCCRVLDYGVRSNFVIDRRRIEELRVQFTDVDKWNQNLSRNLYHFRCWAGSAGFGERFRQQFAEPQHV